MTCYEIGFKKADLPTVLPVFPLTGVLLLPRGQLPLNIFEPRYLAMVDDVMRGPRLIGMVQARPDGTLYNVGCAGRIVSYNETTDGRYEIVLKGITRFDFTEELPLKDGYRRVTPHWDNYPKDLEPMACLDMDRGKLVFLLKSYFAQQGMTCNWNSVEGAGDEKLITSLAMVCPFSAEEKQALLEAKCCKHRAQLFMTLLEMAINAEGECHPSQH